MKIYIRSSKDLSTLEEAIKGYTAKGGSLADQYPFTYNMKKLLYSEASTATVVLQSDIWRKIDLSFSDYESIFNKLSTDGEYLINIDKLESFTKDRLRVFTYGGTSLEYVLYRIPAGTKLNGIDIKNYSVYPEEQEVLLGSNKFKTFYSELDWTHSNRMILTLHPV